MQTIKQIHAGKSQDSDKLRSRCEEIIAFVQKVLSSSVFNVTLGNFATIDCAECGKPIRKRMPHGQSEMRVECYNNECPASYTILDKGNNQVEWQPYQHKIECRNNNCQHQILVWNRETELGKYWTCPKCEGQNVFALGIRFEPKGSYGNSDSANTANAPTNVSISKSKTATDSGKNRK